MRTRLPRLQAPFVQQVGCDTQQIAARLAHEIGAIDAQQA